MKRELPANPEPDWAALVAIDWADKKHVWSLQAVGHQRRERGELAHTPEAIQAWIGELQARFQNRPIALCLEQSRGALLFTLAKYGNLVLYPIHPSTASNFRQAMYPSGSKSDPLDADILLDLLFKHRDKLRPWKPDTQQTRELQFVVEDRRKLVDEKTRCLNRLTARLKMYFPQILSWFTSLESRLVWEFLEQWPDLASLQKASRRKLKAFLERDGRSCAPDSEQLWQTIRHAVPATQDGAVNASSALFVRALVQQLQILRNAIAGYEKNIEHLTAAHPDFPIVSSFPGVGKALAPRLIAALGTQRDRFSSASELQSYTGIAPVQESSGQRRWIHARWACPKFVRQTFQEWAQHSLARSHWARTYYDSQRARGKQHQAAVRSLAFKWIRILYRCWQSRTPYNEGRYCDALHRYSPAPPSTLDIQWKSVAGFSKLTPPTR